MLLVQSVQKSEFCRLRSKLEISTNIFENYSYYHLISIHVVFEFNASEEGWQRPLLGLPFINVDKVAVSLSSVPIK